MYIRTSGLEGEAVVYREGRRPATNLGQATRTENKFDDCSNAQKNAIEATFQIARRSVTNAAAVLGSVYGRPSGMSNRTRQLLERHFHTIDRDNILEIFRNLFRIDQAFQKGLKFECETNCGTNRKCGYAWATQWFGGYGDIHICFDNRRGACSFLNLSPQEQAAVIIHEAAHRHVGIDDKAYVWERPPLSSRDYSKLTSKEAMDNADSYAWFSVEL
jgi:hypothetical protein